MSNAIYEAVRKAHEKIKKGIEKAQKE